MPINYQIHGVVMHYFKWMDNYNFRQNVLLQARRAISTTSPQQLKKIVKRGKNSPTKFANLRKTKSKVYTKFANFPNSYIFRTSWHFARKPFCFTNSKTLFLGMMMDFVLIAESVNFPLHGYISSETLRLRKLLSFESTYGKNFFRQFIRNLFYLETSTSENIATCRHINWENIKQLLLAPRLVWTRRSLLKHPTPPVHACKAKVMLTDSYLAIRKTRLISVNASTSVNIYDTVVLHTQTAILHLQSCTSSKNS